MSLNGLDDARVKEAYDTAIAEPGGWFLLKYATRDELELLGQGNGGIVEIRNNIAQYQDKSPLYGFLRYRRRNVIIKYLPEDCSRLIQARVTVHFDEVCDRFSPHDTTFSIADPKELKDTKLSAACSLHAASGSTSSSTSSLRRRRLMEIAEEEEEEERERKRQSVGKEEGRPKSPQPGLSESPVKLDADLARLPDASRFASELEPPHFTGAPRPSSPTKSFDETTGRMSSQSSRTDLYPTTSYPYLKPRVKLGPRPSTDTAGRPRSSGGSAANRVATVPAGLKSMSKGSKKGRSHSQTRDEEAPSSPIKEHAEEVGPTVEVEDELADSGATPSENEPVQIDNNSESQAPGTAASTPETNMAPFQAPTKQNTMTPEKARLLKAIKLREKKKMMSLQPTLDVPATEIPSAPSTPGLPDEKPESESAQIAEPAEEASRPVNGPQDDLLASSHADSGIDVGADHASLDTPVDSQPTSPLATSEIGDTTQASSLSDSTDETVLAKEGVAARQEGENATDPSEPAPPQGGTVSRDRQSQVTITAGSTDRTPDIKIEETAALGATADKGVSEDLPLSTSSDGSCLPPAAHSNNGTAIEPAEGTEPAAQLSDSLEGKHAGAKPADDEDAPSEQVLVPTSKFSTKEAKSPVHSVPPTSSHTSDVDSWRVGESAPPVPEKDGGTVTSNAIEAAGTEPQRRKFPDPIRTDLRASDNANRRSVLSITDNDGFMAELQSATVEQATPITVAKSPISPFFSQDQTAKRPVGGLENTTSSQGSSRTVSNPVRNSYLAPAETRPAPVRSASSGSAYLQKTSQQTSADLRPKSSKLGSSIFERIKALEQRSGSTPPVVATPKERPASTFFAVRKASTREGSRPPSVVDQASIRSRSPPGSRDSSSPENTRSMGRGRSGSVVNRLSMFEGGMPPRGRPESVQVTARIVRDPNQPFPKGPESKGGSSDYSPLDLKQSPLLVDVQNRVDSRSPVRAPSSMSVRTTEREFAIQAKQTLLERRLSKQSQEYDRDTTKVEVADGPRPRRRSSLSFVKDFIKNGTESIIRAKSPSTDNLGNAPAPTSMASPAISRPSSRAPSVHQPGSLARRLSISSRRSSIDQGSPALSAAALSPVATNHSGAESEAELKSGSGSGDKKSGSSGSGSASPKSSRATRFMRRLSNTLVAPRKNTAPSISPTVAEENAAEVEAASRGGTAAGSAAPAQPTIVAFMGDVNVQFPDNLLWKRRSICLDSQGFLILSSVQGSAMLPPSATGKDRNGILIKRYHMSDFKPPYAPDVELQELPNSVVLDIINGSGLQIACEDRAGQMSILHILEEAHRNHSNFGH